MIRTLASILRNTVVLLCCVLLILFCLRLAEGATRPDQIGMADDACKVVTKAQESAVKAWMRWLLGGRPEFDDWTGQCTYAADNAALVRSGQKVEIVFIGDSITEAWKVRQPDLFSAGFVNRGLTGQSSGQVLARFQSDVVALHPKVVHVLIGTNDVTGSRGPITPQAMRDSTRAIVDLARANGIAVIIGTLPPMARNPFVEDHRPAPVIARHNLWLKQLAHDKHLVLADYHAVLATSAGGFGEGLANDELHPSDQGYKAMRTVLEKALAEAGVRPSGQ